MPGRSAAALLLTPLVLAAAVGCARPHEIDARASCAAPLEVEEVWRGAPESLAKKCGWGSDCWLREIDAARDLRDRHPDVLLAHQLYAREIGWASLPSSVGRALRERSQRDYAALAAMYPRNAAYPYLLSILETNRKARRGYVDKALALDPDFPWAHDAWIREHSWQPSTEDQSRLREHFVDFARLCPAQVSWIAYRLSDLNDAKAWNAVAPALRRGVTPDGDRYADLPRLWEAEFKYAEPSDHPRLREQVRSSLARLAARNDVPSRERADVLRAGYSIAGDAAEKRSAEDAWIASAPCEWTTTRILRERFVAARGRAPSDGDAKQEWLAARAADQEPWTKRCPEEGLLWMDRLAVLTQWAGAPETGFVEAADRVLAILGRLGSQRVAGAYLDKRVRLDRVRSLLDDAAGLSEEQWADLQAEGLEGEPLRLAKRDREGELEEEQALRVRAALALEDPGAAALAIARLSDRVGQLRRSAASPDEQPTSEEARLWRLSGEAHVLSGKNEEAIADYGRSFEREPPDAKTLDAARAVFTRLHGTDAGFLEWRQALNAAPAEADSSRIVHRPLPAFDLKDLAGKAWTSASLRGRAVFVNVWATWCGPCQSELPNVQRLYEKTRGGGRLAVVTLNVDSNPGLVQPFVDKERYTFPVLLAGPGLLATWSFSSIPRSYVIDPAGTIVRESSGFGGESDPDGARWLTETTAQLEAALNH